MGQANSVFKSTPHLLYHFKPFDNKLYLFTSNQLNKSEVRQVEIYFENDKFNLGGLETIATVNGCIYIIGGLILDKGTTKEAVPKNSSFRYSVYTQAEKFNSSAISTDIVAVIDLKKTDKSGRCHISIIGKLPRPRTSHTLVYDKGQNSIYVIGGLEENIPRASCLKIDLNKNSVTYIEDMPENTVLTKPAAIVVDKELFVFDCYSESQTIHVYNTERKNWTPYTVSTKADFVIPKCVKGYAFQTEPNELIFFCALTGEPQERSSYYYFDIENKKFTREAQDNTLLKYFYDKQGNRDYSNEPGIYCQLTDTRVRYFNKQKRVWMDLPLTVKDRVDIIITQEQKKSEERGGGGGGLLACCGKRDPQHTIVPNGKMQEATLR
jgi:hypothetical protein